MPIVRNLFQVSLKHLPKTLKDFHKYLIALIPLVEFKYCVRWQR